MGDQGENDIPAEPDPGHPLARSIQPFCMKKNASREWFAIRTKPPQEQVACSITSTKST